MPAKILCLCLRIPRFGVLILMASYMRSSICTWPYLRHGIFPSCTPPICVYHFKTSNTVNPQRSPVSHWKVLNTSLQIRPHCLICWDCLLLPCIPKLNMDSSGIRTGISASFVSNTAPSTELSASAEWMNEWMNESYCLARGSPVSSFLLLPHPLRRFYHVLKELHIHLSVS